MKKNKCEQTPLTPGEAASRTIGATCKVRRYTMLSMGIGFVPFPGVEAAALSAVQLKMLYSLSGLYGVPFTKNLVKACIAPLVGLAVNNSFRTAAVPLLLKMVPGVNLLGGVSMSVCAGALTHAIGMIFVQHFESGGTFLTFRPDKVRKHFLRLFEEGRESLSKK